MSTEEVSIPKQAISNPFRRTTAKFVPTIRAGNTYEAQGAVPGSWAGGGNELKLGV